MKLYESERMQHMFINVINELRHETKHEKTLINSEKFNELKFVWKKATNRQDAKAWIKVCLGW